MPALERPFAIARLAAPNRNATSNELYRENSRDRHTLCAARAIRHLSKKALTLAQSKVNTVAAAQMFRKSRTVPEARAETKIARHFAQIRFKSLPLVGVERRGTTGALDVVQSVEPTRPVPPHPTPNRTRVFAEPLRDFGARSARSH